MTINSATIKRHLHNAPAYYFLALGLCCLILDLVNHAFRPRDLILILPLFLPAVIQRGWLHIIFGMLSAIVCALFLLEVNATYRDYLDGEMKGPHNYTTTDYIVGLLLTITSLVFSVLLVIAGVRTHDGKTKAAKSNHFFL